LELMLKHLSKILICKLKPNDDEALSDADQRDEKLRKNLRSRSIYKTSLLLGLKHPPMKWKGALKALSWVCPQSKA